MNRQFFSIFTFSAYKGNGYHYALLSMFLVVASMVTFAQAPQVLKDISGQSTLPSQTSAGYNFYGFNGHVYFSAEDGLSSFELWKSDGTASGTVLVKDINAGSFGSSPQNFIEYNGSLYFQASGANAGPELWKTDGTEAGTVLVKDIVAGTSGSLPQDFNVVNGILFFTATSPSTGRELWKTDGTAAGTVMVKEITSGSTGTTFGSFTNFNGTLFFAATDPVNGYELWKSDGTPAGTVLVKDTRPGSANGSPGQLTVLGSQLFFTASDDINGTELWVSDGTEAGTVLVMDIRPGSNSASPSSLTVLGSQLIFTANDGTNGNELWSSDGTAAGTILLKDIRIGSSASFPDELTLVNGEILFNAFDGNVTALWKTDGTPAGTVLVKDTDPVGGAGYADNLTNVNGTLFFTGTTDAEGVELWKSDGTEAGTVMVRDIEPGALSSVPLRLTNVNGTLFFTATVGGQVLLMKSDGSSAGTLALNSSAVRGGSWATFYAYQNKLYFQHDGYISGVPMTATGREPWASDGTDAGTILLKDINETTSASSPGPFGQLGNSRIFAANDPDNGGIELWKTDGTTAGTAMLKDLHPTGSSSPANFTLVNNTIFFTATVPGFGNELWKTDGTVAGTVLVKDIRSGSSSSSSSLLTAVGNFLFFTANDGVNGTELWKSDGTAAGTVLVADLVPGTGSPTFTNLTAANNLLFFTTSLNGAGTELWKSNGTAAGTGIVKDINPGSNSSSPTNLTAFDNKLFFSANNGTNGNELWTSDGTAAGTNLFLDIVAGSSNSNPGNLAATNGRLYFTAFTSPTQFEPWVSDGTPAGTMMIADIVPGSSGSVPSGFTGMDGYVYFAATTSGTGRELWRTDGTAAGTTLVKDINTGSGHSSPEQLTVVNSTLFFRATTPSGGIEFYKSDGTEAGTVGYDLIPGTVTSDPTYFSPMNHKLIFTATHPVLNREVWKIDVIPPSSFRVVGDTTPCVGGLATYSAVDVISEGLTYQWSLPLGGGTIVSADTVATVNWTSAGNYSVQLILSNTAGSTAPKTLNLLVSGTVPTQVPVIQNFARTLSTTGIPPGTYCQWYRNDTLITGATDSSYYAALAGNYTARFTNDCGSGPNSNVIGFPADAILQVITFPHVNTITMSPVAHALLQASASSGLPVFYQRVSGPGYVSNDTLYATGVGTIILKAQQPGDDEYSPAVPVNDTITVIKGDQLIVFDSIPPKLFSSTAFPLSAGSSVGLPISFSVISGQALISNGQLTTQSGGEITVRASQAGDVNYNAAVPVDRTFCVGIGTLSGINGSATPCIAQYRYTTQKIPGAQYVWTLSGGGILTTNNDTAWVQWQTPGTYTLSVKANSSCNTTYSEEKTLNIIASNNNPGTVTGMMPANGAQDQQLPLNLSWIPGVNTVNYDLYLWDSATAEPATPFAANISAISYLVPANSGLAYNTTYKWRIVSKNPCTQTPGPVQHFRLIPLPDLVVSNVLAPTAANSGQNITISWKVSNTGPGRTLTNQSWTDAVFLAFDPSLNISSPPRIDPHGWSGLDLPIRPLLLGTKTNVAALESGDFYTNSFNYTIPREFNLPYYVFVVTNYPHSSSAPLQVTYANDTAMAPQPMVVTLSPTPDLRVDSVFTTASAFSGSTINLTYKVKNYGVVTPVGVSWNDSVFISQSPLFDRSTAMPLKLKKSNGSYYPNAPYAVTYNSSQLLPDSFYTKNLEVIVPNFIFGTWFIYVKTNANANINNNASLYEGALVNNNLNSSTLQVYLTPTPKLTVQSLTIPVTTASVTQTIGANWIINNQGFTDNIEKHKGHYFTSRIGHCPCNCTCPPNTVCQGPTAYLDSLGQGSSYWIDRVYLSTDPGGLNTANAILVAEVNHGYALSGLLQPDQNVLVNNLPSSCNQGQGNTLNVINPGADYPTLGNFTIPSNLPPGSWYVYVYANPTKTVFEYPGTPQIKRSTLPILMQRPDATVSSIQAPANAVGGQTIQVQYNILNNGPGTVFNHERKDRLYISNSPVFDGTAQIVATRTVTENLPVNEAVPQIFAYTLPPSTSGTRYFYVQTNYDSLFRETVYTNNTSTAASTLVLSAPPADLVVSSLEPEDSVFALLSSRFTYTVTNNGAGATIGNWTDSLFISCNSSYSPANSYFIGLKNQARTVAAGGAYTDTILLNLPFSFELNNCFPALEHSNVYFFIKTNANYGAYELLGGNNVGGSGITPFVNLLVDQVVTTVAAPDAATVGFTYPVSWRVKNIGYNPFSAYYYFSWTDGIYFSTDSVAGGPDIKLETYLKYLRLNRNQDSADHRTLIIPAIPAGDYYLYVKTNTYNSIRAEKVLSNNSNFLRDASGAAKKVTVTRPDLADLRDSIISAPLSIAQGQSATVIYRISNEGAGTTYPGTSWRNRLLLSVDFLALPNSGDRTLSDKTRTGALAPGEFFYDTVTVTIPTNTPPGNYVLIAQANSNNMVVETDISNNFGFNLLTVYAPPASDLIVTEVMKPDTVYLGYTIDTLKWVVNNNSPHHAQGNTKDGIYLSRSENPDSSAVLIGIKNKTINMQPLTSDTLAMRALVSGVVEGDYHVIVKADLQDNIVETNNDNNEGSSASPVYVKVTPLPMEVLYPATLRDTNRYYKLVLPDSLIGSTIRVSLTTPDSTLKRNEMYIASSYIPSPAQFDYRFEIPNYGNQQIVMSSVTETIYYIMVRCVSSNSGTQNIILKAEKLPFAIQNVQSSSGGNTGNVTVKITGSLFTPGMTAQLSKPGTTITATAVYYTNSTSVFATFPLQGKPLGIYDVTLTKPDATTATVLAAFSIVNGNNGGLITGSGPNTGAGNGNAPGCDPGAASGLNSQLVMQLVVPPRIIVGWPFVIQVNYNNPTNTDIPAQVRILYSELGIKMSLSAATVEQGSTALYLELTEPGGPPGIIRAGGSGSIVIYSKAPFVIPDDPTPVLFKLQ